MSTLKVTDDRARELAALTAVPPGHVAFLRDDAALIRAARGALRDLLADREVLLAALRECASALAWYARGGDPRAHRVGCQCSGCAALARAAALGVVPTEGKR